jgi:hypothetical protein
MSSASSGAGDEGTGSDLTSTGFISWYTSTSEGRCGIVNVFWQGRDFMPSSI